MVTNGKQDPASSMPAVDDGWWEAVLADEGRGGSRAAPGHQPRGQVRTDGKGLASGRAEPNWDAVKELYLRDQIVLMRVTSCNRGGLLVENEDLCGFVPFSHLVDIAAQADQSDRSRLMESYVGREVRLKVIECVPEEGRIVFSERAAQAEPGRRTALFGSLRAGARASGTVTNITDFGVFVDLGGVEGLIHISELSWGRVAHPSHIVRMGQRVEVQVLDLSAERCRVALSLKRLLANPWVDIGSSVPAGAAVPAVITSILSYGAFARLEQGVEGLIHASEMPLAGGQSVKDLLHEGQAVRVRVMHVDAAHQRMGLTMKIDAA